MSGGTELLLGARYRIRDDTTALVPPNCNAITNLQCYAGHPCPYGRPVLLFNPHISVGAYIDVCRKGKRQVAFGDSFHVPLKAVTSPERVQHINTFLVHMHHLPVLCRVPLHFCTSFSLNQTADQLGPTRERPKPYLLRASSQQEKCWLARVDL